MRFIPLTLITLTLAFTACKSMEKDSITPLHLPYTMEEVTIENPEDRLSLNGILTLPENSEDFPVVILVSGSGPQNYDEQWEGRRPFRIISDYLSRRGIAVLRLNDRDYDKSPLDFYQNNTADFASDMTCAVQFLKNHESTKNSPIGMLGHSEGGIVSTMVASENRDVSFLILLGSPAFTLDKLNMQSAELLYEISETPENDKIKLMQFHEEHSRIVRDYRNDRDARKQAEELYDFYFKKTGLFNRKDKYNLVTKVTLPWYRYMHSNEPASYLRKIDIPLLAIIGEFDSQVVPKPNLEMIKESLDAGGNTQYQIMEMENLNHMLQPTDSYRDYSSIEETVSEELLEEIQSWIKERN